MIAIPEPSRPFGRIIRLWNRLLHHGLEHVPQTMANAFHQSGLARPRARNRNLSARKRRLLGGAANSPFSSRAVVFCPACP